METFGCDCCGGSFPGNKINEVRVGKMLRFRCHGCLRKGKAAVRLLAQLAKAIDREQVMTFTMTNTRHIRALAVDKK